MTEQQVTTTTLSELVSRRVEKDPGQVALVADGVHTLTVGEWESRSRALARRLLDRGVRPGDRVALLSGETGWIDYAIGNLALYMAGATVVGVSHRLPAAELRRRLEHCGVAALLTAGDVERLDRGDVAARTEDLAEILHTSGTTGTSKPIAVSHANLSFGQDTRGGLFAGSTGVLSAVPIGTNACHSAVVLAMTAGSPVHVLSDLGAENIAAMIEKIGVEMAIIPPSTAGRLVTTGLHERYDLSGLTALMLGSAPVPPATVSKVSRALPGMRMMIGYGSTESAPAFVHTVVGESWTGSVGSPGRGTELKVVDATRAADAVDAEEEPLPPGRVGEICLRSPAPQRFYYRDPEATARVFRNGWTHMGDLGHIDEDGFLHFFDRARDVIVRDGVRISSLRVEGALLWHPEVVEAAAFGVPDPVMGQAVAAAVVLRSPAGTAAGSSPADAVLVEPSPAAGSPAADAVATGSSADGLDALLAERLEAHELPDRIDVVDSLPRGDLGKLLKRELR
ncbi:class I adenylate-forming enzyme family protein [Streptosporangium subroseum]|uniref:class I adenylate-forming enzyme family protein n=1 Tax=Streptosporangium subroseum TaxID=106412 RepID=UPI0030881222|nr:acyl--CoA ligase [Streptosporangium subroseum]